MPVRRVYGHVVDYLGVPQPGVTVTVYEHRIPKQRVSVGFAQTDNAGFYEIEYDTSAAFGARRRRLTLQVVAYENATEGEGDYLASSAVFYRADVEECIELRLLPKNGDRPGEFASTSDGLSAYLDADAKLADLDTAEMRALASAAGVDGPRASLIRALHVLLPDTYSSTLSSYTALQAQYTASSPLCQRSCRLS